MAELVENILTLAATLVTLLATTNGVAATTEFSVEPPQCIETGKHPAPACYQYYDCVYVMWWWEAQLVTCPDNQCFDIGLKVCALATLVDCQFRIPLPGVTNAPTNSPSVATTKSTTTSTSTTTTTTTVAPPTIVPGFPNCTGPGKHPAPSCYDYYECVQDVSLWRPVLTTCVVGYAFDIIIIACVPVGQCDCQNRLTTKSSTTSTTSLAPPITYPPSCSGAGKHPAESCYDYYECEQELWWWKPVLKTCVIGYGFDIFIIACVPIKQCDCQNRITTTASTSTSLAPPIIEPPSCSGPGQHPAQSCYDYYECEQELWWWKPVLKTCVIGYAFDIFIIACVPIKQCDCQNRVTTTVSTTTSTTSLVPPIIEPPSCSGPGQHPAQSCYDYYECEQELWWWKPVLKTCVIGYAFDIFIIACVPIKQCDCQNRVTTTVSTTTSTTSLAPPIIEPPSCSGPSKHPAQSCYDYYECEQELWWWKPVLKTCVIGYGFDIFIIACVPIKQCDCQNRVTTTVSTTTSTTSLAPPIIEPPSCSGPSKHPAQSCYDYYECEQELWWWKPVLKTCVIGYGFDIFIIACVPIKQCDCQNRVTTTVSTTTSTTSLAPPIIEPPSCSGPSKHPAQSCYDYYECEQELWWWKPVLKTCVIGYGFDIFIIACVPIKQCDCQNRVTTTVSTTTSTTSLAPPIIEPPSCSGPSKHPAQSCYDYYECEQELWWWKPVLKTCVIGYAFDIFIIACVPIKQCDCQNRVTTTVSTTTSTTSLAPPIIEPPSCSGPSKHPAQSCYDYYECEQELWWWKPVLKTCVIGYAFDIIIIACVPIKQCDCQNRVTTTASPITSGTTPALPIIEPPSCPGPGKHPAPNCYQYYECQQKLWWWEPILQTCTIGYAFDIFIIACAPIASVDCHNRITTTVSPTTPKPTPLPPPIIEPSCYGPSKHPSSSCYQYYECVQVWWWWEPRLLSCERGYAFDIAYSECRFLSYVDCYPRQTTTVTPPTTAATPAPPPIVVPECSGPSRHPAPICYQYYECIQIGWWWAPELKSCSPGESFDVILGVCYPSYVVDCQQRSTTTKAPTPTTAATTPRPPPQVPECHGFSKHPAALCYQYYECGQMWWWWEPTLKTCPEGQGFDEKRGRCICAEAIGCRLPVTEPKCFEPGQYPAHKCNQYYECVPYFWWWRPELKDCPKGQGFATSVMRCVDKGHDCTLSGNDSSENSSKENSSKENASNEKSSKEVDI
ncbi:uncharacterized protein LOC135124541 isoform X2 [Zophobas morio]|uniref:uncharacterized protein LOC135124541 isoform X2 n=1 Tax=Zophobas morio TaxID=2755281 RepID=UPI00308292F8